MKLLPALNRPLKQLNLRLATLKVAHSELGQREAKANWSPRIKEYLNEANIDDPAPWCAAFVNWCSNQAAEALGVISPLESVPLEAYVQSYYAHGLKLGWSVPIEQLKSGDLFLVWSAKLGRYAHIGFVYDVNHDSGTFRTIEGNSNTTGSREGVEVVSNVRTLRNYKFMRWTRKVEKKPR